MRAERLSGAAGLTALRQVRTPGSARRTARALWAAMLVFALGLGVVPWQQSSAGAGRVVAWAPADRQQTVEAPLSGRVLHWYVREGDRVEEGAPLVEMRDNDPTLLARMEQDRTYQVQQRDAMGARIQATHERLRALREGQRLKLEVAEARIEVAERELTAAQESLAAEEAAWVQASLNLERTLALERGGLTSTRELELAQLRVEQARSAVARAQARAQAEETDLSAARLDRAVVDQDADAAIAAVESELNSAIASEAAAAQRILDIDVRLARQQTQLVTSPRAGVLLRVLAGQGGEQLKAGDPILLMVPDTEDRAVELWIDGNDVPLVRVGDPVRVQFEGWPALQFSGWPSVAVGTFGAKVAVIDAADDGQGLFRLLVVPDPADEPWPDARLLRQGAAVKGWVLLGQVSLGYELWRQLNDFPPSLSASQAPSDGGQAAGAGKEKPE